MNTEQNRELLTREEYNVIESVCERLDAGRLLDMNDPFDEIFGYNLAPFFSSMPTVVRVLMEKERESDRDTACRLRRFIDVLGDAAHILHTLTDYQTYLYDLQALTTCIAKSQNAICLEDMKNKAEACDE